MVLGTVSVVLFALGMCMALIPEWNAFKPGVIFGCVGLLLGLITLIVWRKMEHKEPLHITGKTVLTVIVGVVGALALGVGMCFSMVWGKMVMGVAIGLVGIVVLLCLIPLTKGIMVALHWEKYMEHIVQKYNKIYRIQMPKVTPHVCRHTFCSNMAKSGMNPKTLQYIMGHADISVTLNTYTHVKFDDAKDELLRVANA